MEKTTTFNPVSSSGVGFRLEHFVQLSYMASLVLETPFPFQESETITEISFQNNVNAETDDLIVEFSDKHRHYIQSKKGFSIGENTTFYEVIADGFSDFIKPTFAKDRDRIVITTDALSKSDVVDGMAVLDWARGSKNDIDLQQKINQNKTKLKKYLLFKKAIEAKHSSVNQEVIYAYLKCIYIKSYDYLETGSKDLQMLRHFIKPFIADSQSVDDAIFRLLNYVQECNQHGKTINISNVSKNIKETLLSKANPKLSSELVALLKKSLSQLAHSIFDDIDGFHVERISLTDDILSSMRTSKFVAITGDGGLGKSALAKKAVQRFYNGNLGFIYFKGDQLDETSLAKAMANLGVSSDFETLMSQWITLPQLIIYIDSFEKLYESDHKEAALELVGRIREFNNITLVLTCRAYALETLRIKFRIEKSEIAIIPVDAFSHDELLAVKAAKPFLSTLIDNPSLANIINVPFYLNQAVEISKVGSGSVHVSESAFKIAIWENVIERKGNSRQGVGKSRSTIFMDITLRRAKTKKPFAPVGDDADFDSLESLEKDGLLLKQTGVDAYCAAHDLFEDIVISRHFQAEFEKKTSVVLFLESIDTNPVFRRAIRQWIQELLINRSLDAKLFLEQLFETALGLPIVDEILIGILGSNHCYEILSLNAAFFNSNQGKTFQRIYRLCKVAYSKDVEMEFPHVKQKNFGPGWGAMLLFFHENQSALSENIDIQELLLNWSLQFDVGDHIPAEGAIVAEHCVTLIMKHNSKFDFANLKELFTILFRVTTVAKNEVGHFVKLLLQERTNVNGTASYQNREFIKMLLIECYRCIPVYKTFPNEIMELMRFEWYNDEQPETHSAEYIAACFGLPAHQYEYYPASANQTPIGYLFQYHPTLALDFVIELTNRSVTRYVSTSSARENDIQLIQFDLPDGPVKQYGNFQLWNAYRGQGNIPNIISCSLMAFENHLLAKASQDNDLSLDFEKVLKESNSVLMTAVLASIAQEYPLIYGEQILHLLKNRNIFKWDFARFAHERVRSMMDFDNDHQYYTRERNESGNLKFRQSNLEQVVTNLQIFSGFPINELIDDHKRTAQQIDKLWRLALQRMDIRNTDRTIDNDKGVIVFTPQPLPGDLKELVDSDKITQNKFLQPTNFFLWATTAFENGNPVDIETWRGFYEKIINDELEQSYLPVEPKLHIALVGIRDLGDQLTHEEKLFCASTALLQMRHEISLLKTGRRKTAVHAFERAPYASLPKLFTKDFEVYIDGTELSEMTLDFLILLPDGNAELVDAIREHLWIVKPELAAKCFDLLVRCSLEANFIDVLYRKGIRSEQQFKDEIELAIQRVKLAGPISKSDIDILSPSKSRLIEAFLIIPFVDLSETYFQFFKAFVEQLPSVETDEKASDRTFVKGISVLLSHYLIYTRGESTNYILLQILQLVNTNRPIASAVLERFSALSYSHQYPDTTWEHFSTILRHALTKDPDLILFNAILFNSVQNRANLLSRDFKNRKMYEGIISNCANDRSILIPAIKFLSGIGKNFQPQCLNWIRHGIPSKEAFDKILLRRTDVQHFEIFVRQLYDDHLDQILRHGELLEYYILILNILIERDSREAFRFRDELL